MPPSYLVIDDEKISFDFLQLSRDLSKDIFRKRDAMMTQEMLARSRHFLRSLVSQSLSENPECHLPSFSLYFSSCGHASIQIWSPALQAVFPFFLREWNERTFFLNRSFDTRPRAVSKSDTRTTVWKIQLGNFSLTFEPRIGGARHVC